MGLVKLTVLDLRNKVPKIQGPGVGLAISPLLSLFLFLGGDFFLRGWRVLVFNPGAFFWGAPELSLLRVQCLIPFGHYS